MPALDTLLGGLGVGMANCNRLMGRLGAGESRKRSSAFTQLGQQLGTEVGLGQEVPHVPVF